MTDPSQYGNAAVYVCTNKRCRRYRVEWESLLPSAVRAATGGPVRCFECGNAVQMVRVIQNNQGEL